jgi:hypothetical protein
MCRKHERGGGRRLSRATAQCISQIDEHWRTCARGRKDRVPRQDINSAPREIYSGRVRPRNQPAVDISLVRGPGVWCLVAGGWALVRGGGGRGMEGAEGSRQSSPGIGIAARDFRPAEGR